MGFNMYKQIDNIKEDLKNRDQTRNIPYQQFLLSLKLLFGMKDKTAKRWLDEFEMVGFISISNDGKINFNQ